MKPDQMMEAFLRLGDVYWRALCVPLSVSIAAPRYLAEAERRVRRGFR